MAVSVNVGSATNDQAPIISGTIAPEFTDGVADDYSLAQFVTDPEGATLTYAISSGTLPAGVTLNSATGFLASSGGGTVGTTAGLRFSVSDGTNTEISPEFSVVINAAPAAAASSLAFSDLISGPSTGLGDGLGDGAIVTVWGYGLGSSQGASSIGFRDVGGTYRDAAHVYYWKNADGTLPSGPANLFESHGMQEVAFSIPAGSATGAGSIEITVGAETSTLPFTVRSGSIYHIASTGSNGSGTGTFANPWATTLYVFGTEQPAPGSIVYSRDTFEGSQTATGSACQTSTGSTGTASTLTNQAGIIAYPNHRCSFGGRRGLWLTGIPGVVSSKLNTYSSSHAGEASSDGIGSDLGVGATFGISGHDFNRIVGCNLTEQNGRVSSKFQGAIVATDILVTNGISCDSMRIFGNEVHNYGANGSSQQHHTTYLSIRRTDDPTLDAWEWGWNYLHDNKANLGIHNWDRDDNAPGTVEDSCGNVTGTIRIHDNVIIEQGGAGISTGTGCSWGCDFEYYNNVLIETGLAHSWNGTDTTTVSGASPRGIAFVDGSLSSGTTHYVYNNLIWGWNRDNIESRNDAAIYHEEDENIVFTNNICVDKHGMNYWSASGGSSGMSGTKNVWFSSGGSADSTPSFDTSPITTDPLLTQTGAQVSIGSGSPVIDASASTPPVTILRDIYGALRSGTLDVGPIES